MEVKIMSFSQKGKRKAIQSVTKIRMVPLMLNTTIKTIVFTLTFFKF
jgi:hypothetical protein